MSSFLNNIQNISLSSIKNSIDEVRAQYMPNNETEKKVSFISMKFLFP